MDKSMKLVGPIPSLSLSLSLSLSNNCSTELRFDQFCRVNNRRLKRIEQSDLLRV